ncbi:hypothetical protein GTP46_28480 [Duganella sp. FT135W]|uniref:Uncharacterized protein n=1 Tax=Duganella flavida TaxID=2692175 RepID=A0A6L8KIK0_9BURK|nr:hypothetical protein [Duganella flavida]MYM26567.1 hypothetical protein [Duganella flavida]
MNTEHTETKGWSRSAVTYRLSVRRRRDLRALCGAESLSPTAALDRAISIAKISTDFDETAASIDEIRALVSTNAKRSEELLSSMALQIEELKRTIIAVANSEGGGAEAGENSIASPALPIRAWLDAEATDLPRRAIIVKAQWRGMTRRSNDSLRIEFLGQRIVTAGQEKDASAKPSLFYFSLPAQQLVLSKLTSQAFYLKCECGEKSDWHISIHTAADGKLEPAFLTLRA